MRIILAVTGLALLLTACGEQQQNIKDTVFASQVKALEQARSVEHTLGQGAEKNREALESSENSGTTEQR